MKDKPHLLIKNGRWVTNPCHVSMPKTVYSFPYTAAQDWCDARNLKEGR